MTYLIFCLATAILTFFTLINPVIKETKKINPLSSISQHPVLSRVTFFLLSLLVAPVLFIISIVPYMGEMFKVSLTDSLIKS